MRCPKCQYISFDSGDRCRNCGYDFSLAPEEPPPELPIQTGGEPIGPLADFSLNGVKGLESSRPITGSFELPLFKARDEDAPLVTPSAVPRAPLAVRRGAPAVARQRAPRRDPIEEPRFDLESDESFAEPALVSEPRAEPPAAASAESVPAAPWGARISAGILDGILTLAIDATVLYFTLKLCELRFREALALPLVPFAAFLLLLNGGYFASFVAAGGQTLGKMAAGIRVIPATAEDVAAARVPFGQAVLRAAAYLLSAAPAGLGFLAAFFGRDRRALHDRLADTRVVKA
jgi:uncharacterized RDD family membrane protein YckC